MSTVVRPEISKKSEYHIPKHRQLELVHHCLQYPMWKCKYNELNGYSQSNFLKEIPKDSVGSNPTNRIAMERLYYSELMTNVRTSVDEACNFDSLLAKYLFKGVTFGHSYTYMRSNFGIPYCKDTYYKAYRRFFYILDKRLKDTGYKK